jgi:SNF2 family DNA or RNA helicase
MNVYKPYEHQATVLEDTKDREYFALFWEMGLGKSKTLIDNILHLHNQGRINRVLILAPKGVYLNWCWNELPKHIPKEYDCTVAYWRANWNKQERHRANYMLREGETEQLRIFVMNIEAIRTTRALNFAWRFVQGGDSIVVLDESTAIKNPKSKTSINAHKLARLCKYTRIASGTPLTNDPLDIYSQALFLDPKAIPFNSFYTFKHYFAKWHQIEAGNRKWEKCVGYQNLEELQELIAKFSSRLTKVECLDLPDKIFEPHYVEHTAEQKRIYKQMKTEALVEFENNELVSSTSMLQTIMKLHQINCGHVKTDDGGVINIDSNRISELTYLLQQLGNEKVIIWAHFKKDFELIGDMLRTHYGPDSFECFFGDVSDSAREIALDRFKGKACQFLVASQACAGFGLTLVQCAFNIYYSYNWKLEEWLQSQDRTHRIGQTRNVTYVTMQIPGTIDTTITKALSDKKDLSSQILDDWRTVVDPAQVPW